MSLSKTKFYNLYEKNNIEEIYSYFQNFLSLKGGGSNEPLTLDLDIKKISSLPQEEQHRIIKDKIEQAIKEQEDKLEKVKVDKGFLPYDPQRTINRLRKELDERGLPAPVAPGDAVNQRLRNELQIVRREVDTEKRNAAENEIRLRAQFKQRLQQRLQQELERLQQDHEQQLANHREGVEQHVNGLTQEITKLRAHAVDNERRLQAVAAQNKQLTEQLRLAGQGDERFEGLQQEAAQLRQEYEQNLAESRQEYEQNLADLRQEIRTREQELAELRQETERQFGEQLEQHEQSTTDLVQAYTEKISNLTQQFKDTFNQEKGELELRLAKLQAELRDTQRLLRNAQQQLTTSTSADPSALQEIDRLQQEIARLEQQKDGFESTRETVLWHILNGRDTDTLPPDLDRLNRARYYFNNFIIKRNITTGNSKIPLYTPPATVLPRNGSQLDKEYDDTTNVLTNREVKGEYSKALQASTLSKRQALRDNEFEYIT